MSLRKLFDSQNFDKYINNFINLINNKNIDNSNIFVPPLYTKCSSYPFKVLINILHQDYWGYFWLINTDIYIHKKEYFKYKIRYTLICIYKLLDYFINNYLIDYIISIPRFRSYQSFIDYYIIDDKNYFMNPLNKSIYDKKLSETVKNHNILRKKMIKLAESSVSKLVKWYRKHSQNRKTKLLIASYKSLNNLKYNIPKDIITLLIDIK